MATKRCPECVTTVSAIYPELTERIIITGGASWEVQRTEYFPELDETPGVAHIGVTLAERKVEILDNGLPIHVNTGATRIFDACQISWD